jgi:NAD(P)-dependent dehydrogenase (short-subunit alcohol dehydrogenase family)
VSNGALEGQVALVTGAGKRLGRAVALGLAEEGARIVIHYNKSEAEAGKVAAEIVRRGGDALCLRAELTRNEEIERLFTETERHFQRLDILVNNAAVFYPTLLADTTEAQWDTLMDSNLKAQFFCAQRAAPMLRRSGSGRIINFASLGGLLSWPKYTAYCVSKAGVIMLTRCLARALGPEITVNAVAPGTISFPEEEPEVHESYDRMAPLGRTGTPQDIVEAVLYLVKAGFVTGQILPVDGGRTIPA